METRVQSQVLEKPLEKDMAAHTSIPTWRIPWYHKELDTIDQLTYTHIHLIQCPFEQTIQQKQKELGENWDRGAGRRKASGGSMTGTLPEACQSCGSSMYWCACYSSDLSGERCVPGVARGGCQFHMDGGNQQYHKSDINFIITG